MLVVFSGVFGFPIMVFGVFEFKRGINAEQMSVSSVHRGTQQDQFSSKRFHERRSPMGFCRSLNPL